MSSKYVSRIALGAYLLIFFGYLLGPLLVMSLTAFNSSSFPSVSPWACYSYEWFNVLFNDQRILNGIKNSVIIGVGTVILSVAIGLAAALVLTQVWPKLRTTYYTIIIAPILIPGVVLGISTIVFWDRVSQVFGPSSDALFHNGLFLTILGQSTFIASYAMLIFVARLQRFDPGLTEAALDLGATHTQAFRKIMLPFLRPAIASAAVLAFLASFENYNTTTFTFGNYPTLTIELAQKVRYGINPSISALAFIIVVLTIFGALAFEAYRRKVANAEKAKTAKATPKPVGTARRLLSSNPAALMLVMLSFLVIAMVGTAQSHSPEQCKLDVRAAKQVQIDLRIEALTEQRRLRNLEQQSNAPEAPAADGTNEAAPNSSGAFGNVFQGLDQSE
ncbi:spermidine/putrescine ABC transporter permease [Sulfitobacter sp. SK012]|uniref:ABC transporter permease n=1 Tax=Sulfitobacter sp. SK012 TaxID=1389005 RepID=UPI000E0AC7DB|nr:ABC transporter permease [Sulfitobacter sp. SK012]AXI47959.1 spermidine/putrescine ABC transporter permease [Sulfitobacter sp. SK012]